ncbi:TetR/AcrR family transcriptional regulator [Amycolatopsis sp. GM8]|uniref:TetR/AcrR family transcriptional regulator n=1 Tax=Amycolatopsis sp. GM8 TaxID=2896530 RepID=UPI001F31E4E2|nr:TetR/AcrR family transcriptional regulator [Amycolatopsis sp. GM8]
METTRRGSVPERIVRAAAALFRKQGYNATSMRDIADAVGMSKAGLYHHYPTKEELLTEIATVGTDALIAQLRAAEGLSVDPTERLRQFIRGRMRVIADEQDILTVIWQERPTIDQTAFTKIAQQLEAYRAGLTDMISAARQAGTIRADIDPHLLMLAIDGMTGWAYLWMRPAQRYSPEEIGDRFWDYLFLGAITPGTH